MRPVKSSLAACVSKVTLYGRGVCPLHANLRTASMSLRPQAVYLASHRELLRGVVRKWRHFLSFERQQ